MSKENQKTLEVYKEKANTYLANSIEHDNLDPVRAKEKRKDLDEFIEKSFSTLPSNSEVLEIGAADGANSKYIASLGFNVTASDTVDGFVEAMRSQGLKAIKFNAIEDEYTQKYFAIFCWRVFVHFTKEDALKVIAKAYDALLKDGLFVFNAINRETREVDNEWVDFEGEYHMGMDRYYSYFRKEELDDIISQTPFQIQDFHTEGGKENNKWLVYVLKK